MGKKKNREFWESALLNNATYRQYYNRLTELSITMFEWQNLPSTVDERYLELILFLNGQAVFFKDDELGENGSFLALQNASGGKLNVYNVPEMRRAYANNGYNKQLDSSDSVIIYNNYIRTNSQLDVEMFAKRLYNIDRTIDINVNAQKTPIMVLCDENERLTLENLFMQYQGNMPIIKGNNKLNPNAFSVLKTDAPFVSEKLSVLKKEIWNEALTYLGITNVNNVKRERMITDEVLRNQGGTVASRYSRLLARQQACEQINKMFNLNIWCDYRKDVVVFDDDELIGDDNNE